MKVLQKVAIVAGVVLCITPAVTEAQSPQPIREEVAGLLSQAQVHPALARLTAFGEFPGAQIVIAAIAQKGNRLVYSFDLKLSERDGIENVQIDAATGQIICIEYSLEQNPNHHLVVTAPPELVTMVKASFLAARDAADATDENGRVVGSKLRVEQSKEVYIFDMVIGGESTPRQVLIDPATRAVVSPAPQPR